MIYIDGIPVKYVTELDKKIHKSKCLGMCLTNSKVLEEDKSKIKSGKLDLCQYLGHKNSNLLKLHSKP
ncbi:hypothetical protein R2Q71_12845 [Clostridium perfringens]|uniref:hypothetical protein n=1 Tax=Clostridium perfringens TaxID=1502 RepID=UPI0029402CAC|nr:hypothetical protein [Clostridium perfringens]MDV5104821.1 hypothetical protein [Clostridium perfringens]